MKKNDNLYLKELYIVLLNHSGKGIFETKISEAKGRDVIYLFWTIFYILTSNVDSYSKIFIIIFIILKYSKSRVWRH